MLAELIVIAAMFVLLLPVYAALGWSLGHRLVRRVAADEHELSPLGTRARVDETLRHERTHRAARQEAVEAWDAAGRPD